MIDLNTSWLNSENIFDLQLDLNKKQLSNTNNYPIHWNDFLRIVSDASIYTFLDIGCGCGAYYKLIKNHFSYIQYTGIDYSDKAIQIARTTWNYNNFFVKDLWTLDKDYISYFDTVHLGAVLDVMTKGDEALEFILNLKPQKIILSRIMFTEKSSFHEEYLAYDVVKTARYHHNRDNFIRTCTNNHYKIYNFNTNFLLIHEQSI